MSSTPLNSSPTSSPLKEPDHGGRHQSATMPTMPPWREFFNLNSFSHPNSLGEATTRVIQNLKYFELHYLNIVLCIFAYFQIYFTYINLVAIHRHHYPSMYTLTFLYFASLATMICPARYIRSRSPIYLGVLLVIIVLSFQVMHAWIDLIIYFVICVSIICFHGMLKVPCKVESVDDVDSLKHFYCIP